MITRFFLRNCLSFKEVAIEPGPGLVVFSGPSGSGKSLLMGSLLASIGLADPLAELSESEVTWQVDEDESGLLNETPNVLREVKKEKARYFFNGQSLSRAAVASLASTHLRYLSLKDYSDFESTRLLDMIDGMLEKTHQVAVASFKKSFERYRTATAELNRLKRDEAALREQEEFARFEIEKIDGIAPEVGEYEALMETKKAFSQKEKIEAQIGDAERFFDHEHLVGSLLEALEVDSAFFDDAMNELRAHLESASERFEALAEMEIETVLDRLELLSDLRRRYGGIEEALAYCDQKREELTTLETRSEHTDALEQEVASLLVMLEREASAISKRRHGALKSINTKINGCLEQLYLDGAELKLDNGALSTDGIDKAELLLQSTAMQKISAGEFNRLRLALLAVKSESMEGEQGILMLDEIDANLSGEESMSVARVLRTLSRHFQIFVISHQPQLTAMGEQHFLIDKQKGVSRVTELADTEARTEEIARIISGDTITNEARTFAAQLLESSVQEAL